MKLRPEIKATFELDDHGDPVAIKRGDLNHYRIRLNLENAPEDTYAVTYTLHESYYEPVREARDKANKFEEDLTSYGDFVIQAQVRTREGIITTTVPLSTALAESHDEQITAKIESALLDIRNK